MSPHGTAFLGFSATFSRLDVGFRNSGYVPFTVMDARSHPPARPLKPGPLPAADEGVEDDEFSHQITAAENTNLRERVGRLEASIAIWAADLDEASEENARLRAEVQGLRRELGGAMDKLEGLEGDKATLLESISARDAHISMLEGRVVEHDLAEIDSRRTRSRLHAIRRRIRARQARQAAEIEGLRRTVSLGHAARTQVEEELRACRVDAARNGRYLDRLEERIEMLQRQRRHRA